MFKSDNLIGSSRRLSRKPRLGAAGAVGEMSLQAFSATTNLWRCNTPDRFWMFQPDPSQEVWREVYRRVIPSLGLSGQVDDIDVATFLTLGEGQFGSGHWKLSPEKKLYYTLKPMLPRALRYSLRRQYKRLPNSHCQLQWPIEDRYVGFQWEIARQVLIAIGQPSLSFQSFLLIGCSFDCCLSILSNPAITIPTTV